MPGRRIIQFSILGTVLFSAVSVVEVIVQDWTRPVTVILDLVLFGIGCTAFLGAYAIAIGRSRTEEIGVASLYLLTNRVAPIPVRVRLLGAFAVQSVVAVTVASVRPFTAAAFAVLVPMFGLGMNGVWAARHGTFGPRIRTAPATAEPSGDATTAPTPESTPEPTPEDGDAGGPADIEQNAGHG